MTDELTDEERYPDAWNADDETNLVLEGEESDVPLGVLGSDPTPVDPDADPDDPKPVLYKVKEVSIADLASGKVLPGKPDRGENSVQKHGNQGGNMGTTPPKRDPQYRGAGIPVGLNSQGLRHMITDHILPYMTLADLKHLSASVADAIEEVGDSDERWRQDFDKPSEGLTLQEKMMIQGTRTPNNPNGVAQIINAVKSIRDRLNYGLKESKELIDAYKADLQDASEEIFPAQIATWEQESDNPEDCLTACLLYTSDAADDYLTV